MNSGLMQLIENSILWELFSELPVSMTVNGKIEYLRWEKIGGYENPLNKIGWGDLYLVTSTDKVELSDLRQLYKMANKII